MSIVDVGSTNPELLKLLADMSQREAWSEFIGRYSPMIRSICSGCGLKKEDVEDVQGQVVLRLVQTFLCTENRIRASFRGFLRRIISNEIYDLLLAKNRLGYVSSLESIWLDNLASNESGSEDDLEWIETSMINRLEGIQRIMTVVQTKVQKGTWKAFWMITVQGVSCAETAQNLGIPYLTAYQRNLRVLQMIRQEAGLHDD